MRLLELRLIEDHRSTVRFPGNLTVVSGMSSTARAFVAGAIPSLLAGVECGASAFVDIGGSSREVGPGALAQRFMQRDVAVMLDATPFQAVIAELEVAAARATARPLRVNEGLLERARATYETTMQSLQVLERGAELSHAEHRGAIVADEDLADKIAAARDAVDPIAATVRDRSLETAARLEVETGALPGVCRGETADAATRRIARLEAVLFEIDSALHALVPVDTADVEQALDIARVVTADGPIDVPEAIRLADDYRSLRAQIAALEERVASEEGGMLSVNDRLDHARERFAAAETKLQPAHTNIEDITTLERAHDAVLAAERRVSGRFGGRSRKLLDFAITEEQIVLDRLGYPTWSAFIMGARMLDSTAENKRQLELARRELEEVERVWARVMAKLGENPEFYAYLDRLERLQEAAHAVVGDVDDVEGALRALRVDPGPPTMNVGAAREILAACLIDLGFGIESHATIEDLQTAAMLWLTDVRQVKSLHAQLEFDANHCAHELDEARETLDRIQVVGAVDEIDGFGAERLHAARVDVLRAEERVWAHRDAVIRMAQLVAECERVGELEAQLGAEVAHKDVLLGISRELADAAAAKLSLLEAAYAARPEDDHEADQPEGEPIPDRVDALSAVLEARITELRDAGIDGPVPLVLDNAFAGLPATERAELLGWVEGYSLFLQVIYLADGPEVVAWAEGRSSHRTRVVRGDGFFA